MLGCSDAAQKVNALVMEHKPNMVVLTHDVLAKSLLRDKLRQEVLARRHTAAGGTRGLSLEQSSHSVSTRHAMPRRLLE